MNQIVGKELIITPKCLSINFLLKIALNRQKNAEVGMAISPVGPGEVYAPRGVRDGAPQLGG